MRISFRGISNLDIFGEGTTYHNETSAHIYCEFTDALERQHMNTY
jgi:hypothetical protein